jgi:hypothetical protein
VLRAFFASPLAWPFTPLHAALPPGDELPSVAAIDAALGARSGVRFIPARPRGRATRRQAQSPGYDETIVEQGQVPTRERNPHDLANALVWATFPRSKRALHERQLSAVRSAPPGRRSEEGDALAMLDEGGLVIAARADVAAEVARELLAGEDAALRARVARGEALGVVFGHAILEHLARSADAVAGLAVPLAVEDDPRTFPLDQLDRHLAAVVADPCSFTTRRGHGIATASPDVLGRRGPEA